MGLVLLCLLLFFWRTGSVPIFDLDEALYVTCAKQMAQSKDWITPRLNSHPLASPAQTVVPFFEKPILIYWLCASSLHLFGINEWAARLPNALAALLTTLLLVRTGQHWFGKRAGILTGIVYATAPMTVYNARQMTTDGLLVLWFTLAMLSYRVALDRAQTKASGGLIPALIFWTACALAVLTKGAVGLLLPTLVIIVSLLLSRLTLRLRRRKFLFSIRSHGVPSLWHGVLTLRPAAGILLFLLLMLPWHGLILRRQDRDAQGRTWTQEYIVRQHVGRFRGGDTVHNAPLPTYFGYFLLFFFPWSCFATTAFRYRSPTSRTLIAQDSRLTEAQTPTLNLPIVPLVPLSSLSETSDERDAHRFLLVWFWTLFLFFTASAAKLPAYIAPAYPAAALLAGRWLDRLLSGTLTPDAARSLGRSALGALCTGSLLFLAALLLPRFARPTAPIPEVVTQFARHITLVLALGSGSAWFCLRRGTHQAASPAWRWRGIALLIVMNVVFVALTVTEGFAVARDAVLAPYQQSAADARTDAVHGVPIIFYHIIPRRPSMNFYAGYSPYERKETPLVPYLRQALPTATTFDVITSRSTLDTLLSPEVNGIPGARLMVLGQRGGAQGWVRLRLKLPARSLEAMEQNVRSR